MKLDRSVLTVLFFLGAGVAGGMFVRSGVVEVPLLTSMVRNNRTKAAVSASAWPPRVGATFPNMKLTGLSGRPINLTDYRGRVLLIEAIAMGCNACQSFSGANDDGRGPFGDGSCQAGLESLETYIRRFAGTDFEDPRLMYVQVLFYNGDSTGPPSVEEARAWAEHFELNRPNVIVAVADADYLCKETQEMIPGFFLVDQEFRLRFLAGKPPRHDLYRELLPALPSLLEGKLAPAEDSEPAAPESEVAMN